MDTTSEPDPAAAAAADPVDTGRAELRRAAFLSAAREVFLQNGYESASMAEIVKRAGGSMSTLYAQFVDKEGLFQAVIDEQVARLTEQTEVELASHTPLAEGLRRIGEELLAKVLAPHAVDMSRLVIAQARKFPDMANTLARQIPERTRAALARYIADRVAAGEIRIVDCDAAAAVFFDMIRCRLQLRSLLDPGYLPSEAEMKAVVDRAVKVFVGGAGAL
jgi:AcrR family transcriptional regulator